MGRRLIELTGRASVNNEVFVTAAGYQPRIEQALLSQGFDVVSVRTTGEAYPDPTGLKFTIQVNVDEQFTAEDARASAYEVIANIPTESWIFSGPALTNVTVEILSEGKAPTTDHNYVNDSVLQDSLNKITQVAEDLAKDAVKETASNWTTPIAVAAVVIFGIVWLKK